MAGREAIDDEVSGGGAGVRQPERREHEVADGAIDRGAGDRFDDTARNAEPGVVVTPRGRGRLALSHVEGRNLHQVGHYRFREVAQRVFSAIGAGHLALPAALCVSRFQIVTSRLTASSRTLNSGRYCRTGALRSIFPCSASRMTIVAAKVLEMEAMGKTV